MNRYPFLKYTALGNDFVIIDGRASGLELTSGMVPAICDRRLGIGADGLIITRAPDQQGDARMELYNADGSRAEMSGNGIRCLADSLDLKSDQSLDLETDAGMRRVVGGEPGWSTVSMGRPEFRPSEVPVVWDGQTDLGAELGIEGGTYAVDCVSMGNPHCVLLSEKETLPESLDWMGRVARHPVFPEGTNVELALIVDRTMIDVTVFERGVGFTPACGTGASAAAVAAARKGLTDRKATVRLPGGCLRVNWDSDDEVYLSGPVVRAFEGVIEL